ncbi:hypothetical protein BZZ01_30270 [Nostocales cyanobacterium HT-58-2]|nr:hypothetical protein BZZ01_30270 [Nostocales cyanobacterium HT-58-2]
MICQIELYLDQAPFGVAFMGNLGVGCRAIFLNFEKIIVNDVLIFSNTLDLHTLIFRFALAGEELS